MLLLSFGEEEGFHELIAYHKNGGGVRQKYVKLWADLQSVNKELPMTAVFKMCQDYFLFTFLHVNRCS